MLESWRGLSGLRVLPLCRWAQLATYGVHSSHLGGFEKILDATVPCDVEHRGGEYRDGFDTDGSLAACQEQGLLCFLQMGTTRNSYIAPLCAQLLIFTPACVAYLTYWWFLIAPCSRTEGTVLAAQGHTWTAERVMQVHGTQVSALFYTE